MAQSKRIGRPTKAPTAGERASLGLKVTSEVKNKLDEAARASGRTQSQEAELRIEHTFEREDLLSDVLSLAFGQQLGAVLLMLGEAMKAAGELSYFPRRSSSGARSWKSWIEDPYAFDQSVKAANCMLEALRPPGEIELPAFMKDHQDRMQPGEFESFSVLNAAAQGKGKRTETGERRPLGGCHPQKLRGLLGPALVRRIEQSMIAFVDSYKKSGGPK